MMLGGWLLIVAVFAGAGGLVLAIRRLRQEGLVDQFAEQTTTASARVFEGVELIGWNLFTGTHGRKGRALRIGLCAFMAATTVALPLVALQQANAGGPLDDRALTSGVGALVFAVFLECVGFRGRLRTLGVRTSPSTNAIVETLVFVSLVDVAMVALTLIEWLDPESKAAVLGASYVALADLISSLWALGLAQFVTYPNNP